MLSLEIATLHPCFTLTLFLTTRFSHCQLPFFFNFFFFFFLFYAGSECCATRAVPRSCDCQHAAVRVCARVQHLRDSGHPATKGCRSPHMFAWLVVAALANTHTRTCATARIVSTTNATHAHTHTHTNTHIITITITRNTTPHSTRQHCGSPVGCTEGRSKGGTKCGHRERTPSWPSRTLCRECSSRPPSL
jgi:hypothetical protein